MSNPVPPGGAYPPPGSGQPGFPAQPGQPGQPYPQQGQPYPQGQGYPQQGQPGQGYPQGQPGQGYPQQGQPGQGYPQQGQPGFPQQGQPGQQFPPQGGQPGFPPPAPGQEPQQFGTFPTEKKKSGAGKIILRILLVVVVGIIGLVVKTAVFGGDDKAKEAKAGDCIASDKDVSQDETTKTGAKVVDCGSTDAKFTVVARVDGESNVESKSCDKFFKEKEEFYVYGSEASGGYLLCLRPKA